MKTLLGLIGLGLLFVLAAWAKILVEHRRAIWRARLQTFARHGREVGGICPCRDCARFRLEAMRRT